MMLRLDFWTALSVRCGVGGSAADVQIDSAATARLLIYFHLIKVKSFQPE